MSATPEQLRALLASNPSDPHVLHAIRENVLRELQRRIPARTGVCPGGSRAVMDEKGAMSSGYLLHTVSYGVCEHKGDVAWDEPSAHVKALMAERERLLFLSRSYRDACDRDPAFRRKRLT